jgi:hypothetical protein
MAKVINFYIPQNFKRPARPWVPDRLRGKVVDFSSVLKRSA